MPHEPEKWGKASRSDGSPLPFDDSAISCPPPPKKSHRRPPPLSQTSHVSVPPIARGPLFSIPPHVLRAEGRDPSFRLSPEPDRDAPSAERFRLPALLCDFRLRRNSPPPARRASALPREALRDSPPPRLRRPAPQNSLRSPFRRTALQPTLRICRAPSQAKTSATHRPQHGLQRPPPSDARSAERLRTRDAPGPQRNSPDLSAKSPRTLGEISRGRVPSFRPPSQQQVRTAPSRGGLI